MSKLQSPEEVQTERVETSKAYLKKAEDMLSEMLGPLFGEGRINGTDEVHAFMCEALDLRGFVMALRRYPQFDISCLSAMKPFTWTQRQGTVDVKVEVMVPTFGIVQFGYGSSVRFNLMWDRNECSMGHSMIRFDTALQRQNQDRLNRANVQSGPWVELAATAPQVPLDVKRRVDEARNIFSGLYLVWEAEWGIAPVVDPLIIGVAGGKHFLVDKYDVTKLERYISSEMTRGPLKA